MTRLHPRHHCAVSAHLQPDELAPGQDADTSSRSLRQHGPTLSSAQPNCRRAEEYTSRMCADSNTASRPHRVRLADALAATDSLPWSVSCRRDRWYARHIPFRRFRSQLRFASTTISISGAWFCRSRVIRSNRGGFTLALTAAELCTVIHSHAVTREVRSSREIDRSNGSAVIRNWVDIIHACPIAR